MKSTEIRKKFIDFFAQREHTVVPSSSLIPTDDPTLLFANAGMNQFKDVFLGKEKRNYNRAVSVQKCIRAGGKHNDLEAVGFTARHLTFFEMLGNFSFGDYFKKKAIRYAWDFLTKDVGLDAQKLYASVYRLDDEAYAIWHTEIGLAQERIVRLGEADNFWQMGDVGPCGPCTEIYFDRGDGFGCGSQNCAPGCSCDRFIEIWNLVFMQFDRQADGSDRPLKHTGVDTGMGLERLCMVVQGKDSVYDTDLFGPILACIEQLTGKSYTKSSAEIQGAMRVIADHIRSASFAIADNCMPSNEGRGYVLRKIIRRAALFAQKLSAENFFPHVYDGLVGAMGDAYPELKASKQLIMNVLTSEIEKFSHNLVNGQAILEKYFAQTKDQKISGAQAFKLYDTYGFPLELTKVIAQEQRFTVDEIGFEKEMEQQRLHSGKKQVSSKGDSFDVDPSLATIFTGYDELETDTHISGIFCHSVTLDIAPAEESCWFVTPRSPFYVECGGQVSDKGWVQIGAHKIPFVGLKKIGGAILFEAKAPFEIRRGDAVRLIVDRDARMNAMKNHTATHLLQSALINIVGKTVKQAGSLVTPQYLRFDFTHYENLTSEQIQAIEDVINQKIMENIPLKISSSTFKDAVAQGVIAFFGEKYNPEEVRVVAVPGFSAELCGGTHVSSTGDIGCFKITEVSALSAGNRRIVAVTGPQALKLFQEDFGIVKKLSQDFKVQAGELHQAINKQRDLLKSAQAEVHKLKSQLYKSMIPQWLQQVELVGLVPYAYIVLEDATAQELRDIAQDLLKHQPGLYVLVSMIEDRIAFMVTVAPELASRVPLKELASTLKDVGLKGGVSQNVIQGGGVLIPAGLQDAIRNWLRNLK